MTFISECLQDDPKIKHLLELLRYGKKSIYLHGLVKESMGHFIVSLMELTNRPVFVVAERSKRAMELASEIDSLLPGSAQYFPEQEINFFNVDTISSKIKGQRLQVINRLLNKEPFIATTTLSAMKRRLSRPEDFRSNELDLIPGQDHDLNDLAIKLHSMRYERVPTVEHRGQFSIRGGIVDVFPLLGENPVRLEFFDTELDSIRYFDVSSQRSIGQIDRMKIESAEELQFTAEDLKDIHQAMKTSLQKLKGKNSSSQNYLKAEDKFSRILDRLDQGLFASNDDLVAAYLDEEKTASILDYLDEGAMIVFDDFARIYDYEAERNRHFQEEFTQLLAQGDLFKEHGKSLYSLKDLVSLVKKRQSVNVTQILKRLPLLQPDEMMQIRSMEAEQFHRRWDDFCHYLQERKKQSYRTLIFAGHTAPILQQRLTESGVLCRLIEEAEREIEPGEVAISRAFYSKGFVYPESRLQILTNYEISGREKKTFKKAPKKEKKDLLDYQDLEVGDFVVHENYGIGEYRGTKTIEIQDVTKDFIEIRYHGTDVLYVSTDEMNLVAKYIGNSGKAPKLSSLGTSEWAKSKARVKKAVDEIADDLVALYAKRSKIKGHAFAPDTPWQGDFEAAFPYEETHSQLRAIEEIKEDMEKEKPMDRLLCGDVGFGKTEVALRAAFKAIMDGKQVAFLCPTTILTQQHYSTMLDRFKTFPVRVEFLSRFKSPQQQKKIIQEINGGAVDIVVGTHRLLSKEIRFKDLGLLIIDEEQRFGVKDKEKIKQLKENIDVLTLSATPIPRTLQLSLTGIRDMSLLEEPPEERFPTTAYVLEYDSQIIKNALERELDRGGQVYFVYNRVSDIHRIQQHIQDLVPDASLAVAHGRMSSSDLENIMESFVSGDIDILLSTTIIETGMDIPNVNTLIVYRSDYMGLSQLYQLKGRIGRSDRKAYAYFTYEANKVISEISEKRLKAIRDFTEFGSGYKIAMRDLELRGAGNILGESQSGQVESVGYDLYVKMLEEAVMKAKGVQNRSRLEEITVDIKVDAYISDDYIPHTIDKIYMYRKIASIENTVQYQEIIDELIDRFGDVPHSVLNIMDVSLIRKMATRLGFKKITEVNGHVELRYDRFEQFSVEKLKAISENYKGPLTFDFQGEPRFKVQSGPKKLEDVKKLLQLIEDLADRETVSENKK